MELDFGTVKALSSPTRIKILNQVLEKESTPTSLSDNLGKSKSTVSSHLETLLDAGLVEKDAVEGRRRVVYQPTRKAQHIVEGHEKRVKFSLTSSIVSCLAGLSLVGSQFILFGRSASNKATELQAQSDLSAMTTEGADAAAQGAQTAAGGVDPATVVLGFGVGFLTLSAATFIYGIAMRKLGQ